MKPYATYKTSIEIMLLKVSRLRCHSAPIVEFSENFVNLQTLITLKYIFYFSTTVLVNLGTKTIHMKENQCL